MTLRWANHSEINAIAITGNLHERSYRWMRLETLEAAVEVFGRETPVQVGFADVDTVLDRNLNKKSYCNFYF